MRQTRGTGGPEGGGRGTGERAWGPREYAAEVRLAPTPHVAATSMPAVVGPGDVVWATVGDWERPPTVRLAIPRLIARAELVEALSVLLLWELQGSGAGDKEADARAYMRLVAAGDDSAGPDGAN